MPPSVALKEHSEMVLEDGHEGDRQGLHNSGSPTRENANACRLARRLESANIPASCFLPSERDKQIKSFRNVGFCSTN